MNGIVKRATSAALLAGLLACFAADAAPAQSATPDYAALLAAPDRSDADRRRRPPPVPAAVSQVFAGVRPG